METKHTPGPWKINEGQTFRTSQGELSFHIDTNNGTVIATTYSTKDSANAKLIAAAPELLDALIDLIDYLGEDWTDDENVLKAKKVIKKATE